MDDTMSPKLFIATLEIVFRKLNWNPDRYKIREYLNYLRFADNIIVFSTRYYNRTKYIMGLKINRHKIKIMINTDEDTKIMIEGV